jgi:hypothetical protein
MRLKTQNTMRRLLVFLWLPFWPWTAEATDYAINSPHRAPSHLSSTRPLELLNDRSNHGRSVAVQVQLSAHQQQRQQKGDHHVISSVTTLRESSDDDRQKRLERQLQKTSMLAFANLVFNLLRPDSWLPFAVRLPRFIWETAIMTTCRSAHHSTSSLLVLAIMTLAAALMDMFVGAPVAALFVTWETCEGGRLFRRKPQICYPDPMKGYGRLLVTLQCAFTGVVYLETAMLCYDAYQRRQREETVGLQKQAVQEVISAFR